MPEKVLFIDRDGTLIREPDDYQVDALDKVHLVDDVIPSLLELGESRLPLRHGHQPGRPGHRLVSARGFRSAACTDMSLFEVQGIIFDEIFICPHLPADNCECRKPRTGLLTRYLAAHNIDLAASAVIGDRQTDMELAERIGVRGILVNCDAEAVLTWPQVVERLCYSDRVASVERNTNETQIRASVNLDTGGDVFDRDRHRILRSHARANRQAWGIQPDAAVRG